MPHPIVFKSVEDAISTIKNSVDKKQRPVVIALDGRSGTGKSTIAKLLAAKLDGVAIEADDFWIGGSDGEWDARSPKEKYEKVLDYRRLRKEVLEPLLSGKDANWHPFNWATGHGLSEKVLHAEPKKTIMLDGAYSSQPILQDIIDISILVDVPNDVERRARLVKREGPLYMADWHRRWDPAEDLYFSKVRPRESFDLIIENHSNGN